MIHLCNDYFFFIIDSYWDSDQRKFTVKNYNGSEEVYIDNVKLCGSLQNNAPRRVCITYRIPVCIFYSLSQQFKTVK